MRTKTIAAAITAKTTDGPVTTVEYQPGNGTRYKVTIIDMTDTVGYLVALWTSGSGTCMTVRDSDEKRPLVGRYVAEKLRVSLADGIILAELIANLIERTAADASDPKSYEVQS